MADRISDTFAALADPTRREILARLAVVGEANVNELAEPFVMTLQAVSKHIKVLENAGLITRGRVAQSRPCRLADSNLGPAFDWIEIHRRRTEDRLDRFDQLLQTAPRPHDNHREKD